MAAGSLLIAPATQATQPDPATAPAKAQESDGASVAFFGHYCGEGDSSPKPQCDYTPTEDQSYGGFGPFTIHVDGKLIEKCPQGRFCGDQGQPALPAGSTVMIKVFGPPGMVTAGGMG